MAQWVQREWGKGTIDLAGAALLLWLSDLEHELDEEQLRWSAEVIQNWRASHAFPLNTFQVNLRARARRVDPGALVAQRLKRFSSVMNKLARQSQMKLSQMQDLGGCRAIVKDVATVMRLFDMYRGPGDELFETDSGVKTFNYIQDPKSDGYRGIHVVARYSARVDNDNCAPWNHQRIEVQLRTRLQHAFSTAVETVTTFTRTPLKFGGGGHDWRRFFALMGSALALREGTPLVAGTPDDEVELARELAMPPAS